MRLGFGHFVWWEVANQIARHTPRICAICPQSRQVVEHRQIYFVVHVMFGQFRDLVQLLGRELAPAMLFYQGLGQMMGDARPFS